LIVPEATVLVAAAADPSSAERSDGAKPSAAPPISARRISSSRVNRCAGDNNSSVMCWSPFL
jgi:hypothetical protein